MNRLVPTLSAHRRLVIPLSLIVSSDSAQQAKLMISGVVDYLVDALIVPDQSSPLLV
jgi:hypothetical protein